eukprot:Amastigsp_a518183_5.p2 type:complete len:105 gc:universal Amastigsp_a518183_5:658-344(-)
MYCNADTGQPPLQPCDAVSQSETCWTERGTKVLPARAHADEALTTAEIAHVEPHSPSAGATGFITLVWEVVQVNDDGSSSAATVGADDGRDAAWSSALPRPETR